MNIDLFDYNLPEELIAEKPIFPRDSSRLMVCFRNNDNVIHTTFSEIDKFLDPTDVIVVNNTKVINARLIGERDDGKNIEILLLSQTGNNTWKVIAKPNKYLKIGKKFIFKKNNDILIGKVIDEHIIEFDKAPYKFGIPPIPPYIVKKRKKMNKTNNYNDEKWYQTVYAKEEGAIAAPTAGFHFTEELINKLKEKGIKFVEITLHINTATFIPLKNMENSLGEEEFTISESACKIINEAKQNKSKIVAVGTSVVRALESSSKNGIVYPNYNSRTNLFISPGFKFQIIDKLITNFHLPKSTPFILVCSFAQRDMVLKWYQEAINNKYRFLSYGDSMLII